MGYILLDNKNEQEKPSITISHKKSQIINNPKRLLTNKISEIQRVKASSQYIAINDDLDCRVIIDSEEELSGYFNLKYSVFDFNMMIVSGIGMIEDADYKASVKIERMSQDAIIAEITTLNLKESASPVSFTIQLINPEKLNEISDMPHEHVTEYSDYSQSQYENEIRDQQYQEQGIVDQQEVAAIREEELARMSSQEELDHNQAILDAELPWSVGGYNFNFEENAQYGQEGLLPETFQN
jgi:hypothetical protein